MAYIYTDSKFAPCAFLIVPNDGNPYSEGETALIQTDWDYPGVASRMGFVPCDCGHTDGTIDCEHKTASQMITDAGEYIRDHEGEFFPGLDDYLPDA